jgi:hypothetical protein
MMWMLDQAQPADFGTRSRPAALGRYRAYGRFYDRYWARLFSVTQADLGMLAEGMRETGAAATLTAMAQYLISLRLLNGPQLHSGPVRNGHVPAYCVRYWDPALIWHVGDRTLLLLSQPGRPKMYTPRVGEVIHAAEDHVVLHVDGLSAPQVYPLAPLDSGRKAPNDAGVVTPDDQMMGEMVDEIDRVLCRYGDQIVGQLFHALEADDRFTALEGWWFLHELGRRPREVQLVSLTRAIFAAGHETLTTGEALALLSPDRPRLHRTAPQETPTKAGPLQPDAASLFGLLGAMSEHSELFKNVGAPMWPRWALAGPPPARMVARHAAYDPETYEVLCTPGETLTRIAAQRLWDTGLLRLVLSLEPTPDASASFSDKAPDMDPEGETAHDQAGVDASVTRTDSGKRRDAVKVWQEQGPPDLSSSSWPRRFPFSS